MIQYRRELYKLLPPDFASCEVGVAEGYFSADILEMGASKHYMVDAWQHLLQTGDGGFTQEWHDNNYYAAVARVAKYRDKAIILRGLSDHMAHEIPDESLDLVYIDGDHSYQGVKRDIASYWPKLKTGGVMAFHDYKNPAYGVRGAVLEFADIYSSQVNIIPEDSDADAGAYVIK
jgi:hypothetical protein